MQVPLSIEFPYLHALVREILALERFDGDTDTHIVVAPWLNLLAAIDDVPDDARADFQQTILATLLESQRQEDYPIWHLVRFPGKRIDTLLECMTRCANVTKKDDVLLYLKDGGHMGNLRAMKYLHALTVALLHQKVEPDELTAAVRALQWSDHKIFLLAVVMMQDIGFWLLGMRVEDEDPPDWFAARPLAKPLLLALYKEESSEDGQKRLRLLLQRMGFLKGDSPEAKIATIPADLKGAAALIGKLSLSGNETAGRKKISPSCIPELR